MLMKTRRMLKNGAGVISEGISFFRQLPRGNQLPRLVPADRAKHMLHRVGSSGHETKESAKRDGFAFWAVSDVNGEDLRAFAGLEMQQS